MRDWGGRAGGAAVAGLYMAEANDHHGLGRLAPWVACAPRPASCQGHLSGQARAMPRAWVAAQALPGASGQAGLGPLVIGSCRALAGPNLRAMGWADRPRAACTSIHRTWPAGLVRSAVRVGVVAACNAMPVHAASLVSFFWIAHD